MWQRGERSRNPQGEKKCKARWHMRLTWSWDWSWNDPSRIVLSQDQWPASLCPYSDQSQDASCPRQCHDLDLRESLKGLRAEGHWQTAFLAAVATSPLLEGHWVACHICWDFTPSQTNSAGLLSALSHLISLQPCQVGSRVPARHIVKRSLQV